MPKSPAKHVLPVFGDTVHAAKGSDAGTDPHHAQTEFLAAENAVYPRRAAVEKRRGTVRGATVHDATTLAEGAEGPLLLGGANALHLSPGTDTTHEAGAAYEPLSITSITANAYASGEDYPYNATPVDAHNGGTWVAILRWVTGDGLKLEIYDKGSRALIDSEDLGQGATTDPARARFCIVGGVHMVAYANSVGAYIRDVSTAGAIGASRTITTTVGTTAYAYFDACECNGDLCILVNTGAAWWVWRCPAGTVPGGGYIVHTTAAATCGAIWPVGADKLGIAYGYVSGANHLLDYQMITVPSLLSHATPCTLATVTAATDEVQSVGGLEVPDYSYSGSDIWWTTCPIPAGSTSPAPRAHRARVDDGGGGGYAARILGGTYYKDNARLWSNPALLGTDTTVAGLYMQSWDVNTATVSHSTHAQAECFLANTFLQAIGRALPGTARTDPYWLSSLSDPLGTGTLTAAAGRTSAAMVGAQSREARDVMVLGVVLDVANEVSVISHAGAALVGGSCPTTIAGQDAFPSGHLQYPDPLEVVAGGTGPLTIGAVYRFKAILDTVDSLGHLHRSAPTPLPVSFTPASSAEQKVVVSARVPDIDSKSAKLVVYRTTGNGTTYYRDGAESPVSGVAAVTCSASDATLEVGDVLYTQDSILEYMPPPPYIASCIHKGRIFVVPQEFDETTLRYSAQLNDHNAPAFHENLELLLPFEGGRIIAIASEGGVLYALKESAVYAIQGDPATADGQNATWGEPFLVSNVTGCTVRRSVVVTPAGAMFAAADKSIWSVSGGTMRPIGDRQRYYTDTYGPVISATIEPQQHIAVFALAASGAPVLVYDYLHDKWAQWTTRGNTVALAAHDGVIYRRDGSGYVWRQTAGLYADDDGTTEHWQGLRLRTGFAHKTTTPDGWQRISEVIASGYKHGSDGFDLKIACAYNGEPSFESKVRDTAAVVGFDYSAAYGAGSSTYEGEGFTMRFQPSARKQGCSSIMVEVSDTEGDDGAQRGFTLTSLGLLVTPKAKTRRIGRARNVKD